MVDPPRLSYAERKRLRERKGLHMRQDSTGSVGHSFYATNDKITPNKEKRHRRRPNLRLPQTKDDEEDDDDDYDILEAQQQQQYAHKYNNNNNNNDVLDTVNDSSDQSSDPLRGLASFNHAASTGGKQRRNKRSSVNSTLSDDSLRYSRKDLPPMSTIDGLTAEDYSMNSKRSSEADIAHFSAMVLSSPSVLPKLPRSVRPPRPKPVRRVSSNHGDEDDNDDEEDDDDYDADEDEHRNHMDESEWTDDDDEEDTSSDNWWEFVSYWFNPTDYLMHGTQMGPDGKPYFVRNNEWWSLAATVRQVLYNPLEPEFTSLQQFSWAIIIGVVMGVYVSFWKTLIEGGVDFMWKKLPAELLRLGFFTDLDGSFPLYHYMWICPAVWGGILSYVCVILPFTIPDQNEWITGVHSKGILDHRGFGALFVLSTLAMMSGLSLGPELPLVLTAGIVGSWFGLVCKQSMLQARVLNLTAASAAVGGFFGFPMAGAMFVLEIPHRMGLQYFEALSPATISSIVAVLTNRMIINNDVTGYYSYPFLSASLPSEIFTSAIVYGLYGALVGLLYGKGALLFKGYVHDFFRIPRGHQDHDRHTDDTVNGKRNTHSMDFSSSKGEETPLVLSSRRKKKNRRAPKPQPTWRERMFGFGCIFIKDKKKRAALAGFVAGGLVGLIGMFLPHTMFWGEAQLQNLIDKGRTPLPIFTTGIDPTAGLTALSMCIIDPKDHLAILQGFGIGCSFLITFAKIVVVGLSLGTGIIGGHFWGPLFCGCSAAHLFTDISLGLSKHYGIGGNLSAYPCVAILCTMGSAHVVTYRAHMAIMLILTLTISTFNPQNETDGVGVVGVSGDYSAVFPLLVVSVFVALMVSRSFVFYGAQRSRGDILAIPEVLCEPGMKGRPAVIEYVDGGDNDDFDDDEDDGGYAYVVSTTKAPTSQGNVHVNIAGADYEATPVDPVEDTPTQLEIEWGFAQTNAALAESRKRSTTGEEEETNRIKEGQSPSGEPLSLTRLDELLKEPLETSMESQQSKHRRFHSAPDIAPEPPAESRSPKRTVVGNRERADSASSSVSNRRKHMLRINSYGEIHDHQPSLMDQARERSASSAADSLHRRVASTDANETKQRHHRRIPSFPGLPRKGSTDGGSVASPSGRRHRRNTSHDSIDTTSMEDTGALLTDDIEHAFHQVVAERNLWTQNSLP